MLSDWMEFAACLGIDEPEKFFDLYLESEEVAMEVQGICVDCPVKLECLNYGMEMKSTGVWGGRWLRDGKIIKKLDTVISSYYWRDD